MKELIRTFHGVLWHVRQRVNRHHETMRLASDRVLTSFLSCSAILAILSSPELCEPECIKPSSLQHRRPPAMRHGLVRYTGAINVEACCIDWRSKVAALATLRIVDNCVGRNLAEVVNIEESSLQRRYECLSSCSLTLTCADDVCFGM